MKSVSIATAAAVLAGMSIAQPHRHHHGHHHHGKRSLDIVTEWETVWETVTVVVEESATETLYPSTTGDGEPGQFFQPPSSTLEPTSSPVAVTSSVQVPPPTTVVVPTSSQEPPPPAPTPSSTSISTSTPTPTSTSISTSTPAPAPTPTSSSVPIVSVSVSVPAPIVAPPTSVQLPAPVAPPTNPSPDSGYTYAGPDAFGTSPMDTEIHSGDITYYIQGLGACGYDDTGKDTTTNLVAISEVDWMSRNKGTSLGLGMPNHPWCDQMISITSGTQTTTARVHDNCPGCLSGSIDVSESVFTDLFGSLTAGREHISWKFI
ncbi:expansin family protein [Xylaria nigripes]|nr:expansin family protein [Xylaria nigripes]